MVSTSWDKMLWMVLNMKMVMAMMMMTTLLYDGMLSMQMMWVMKDQLARRYRGVNAYGVDVDAVCVHVSLDLRSLPAKPQPANRCPPPLNLRWDQFGLTSRYWSERQRRTQKLFVEEGGRTQNVNRSLEIRLRRHKTLTVRQKRDAKR